MRRLGVNLLVWSGEVGAAELRLLPRIAQMGYAGVEIPIFAPDTFDVPAVRAALDESGLACTVSSSLPAGLNLIDAPVRAESVRWLQQVIRHAAALDAQIVCGPLAVPVGELRNRGYVQAEWDSCVQALRELGRSAAEHDVTLAFEPLNRFETFFLNTVADSVRLVEEVDQPNVGLLLDTFHQHIEEKSTTDAIRHAGPHIKHFHASENDRGIVGSGQIDWPPVMAALDDAGYDGWIVVESFNSVIPELAGATCIWRQLADSPETLAQASLEFLTTQLE